MAAAQERTSRSADTDAQKSGAADAFAGGTGSGKVAHAHNSEGHKDATQTHQSRRTPESRHDRDAHIGSGNQVQSRRGAAGNGGGPGGGARGAG
ncbi:hypothetical protein [Acidovorax sp.]|uniref:hypothetical protein n=1 Tax=Acidovorax sp. TaxID=1872122 RepID=UPI0039192DBC